MEFGEIAFGLLSLIVAGALAGTLAGLFGVGGGIVVVPVLYFLLQKFSVSAESAMSIATATSLATIVPTAISSVRAHHLKGNVDFKLLKFWGAFILSAAIAGSAISTKVSGDYITWMFGVIAICVSFNMIFRADASALFSSLPGRFFQAMLATVIGGFSVMIGIGGGTLGVPILTSFNFNTHRAVGTAAAFGLLIALPGVLTLIMFGQTPTDAPLGTWRLIHLPAFFAIIPLTMLFAPIGAKLGTLLDARQLKRGFAIALLLTGSRMLYQVI